MLTNKKIETILLSREQQILSRKLRKEYEKKASDLRSKVIDLNSSLSFYSKFENENPHKESQLYCELKRLKDALRSLQNNHRNQARSILTEKQKVVFDSQQIDLEEI